ncbi:PREDICTED: uncharacterized protein LOC108381014 isoform X1 [Rhagoletis zephyria]|uniref:uncharacterized protein LOC108381014 isoform X1 n=1 Tax=Rhagoletis zephyria TaxID=28612 RepID=UPI0008118F37|nr:PREDICTED: uncharacterized protein LOC108381014 isoform X1 [Rhagoletis zephyria]
MQCLDSDNNDSQYNKFTNKIAEECRELVDSKPPFPPFDRPSRKPPTLDTFCNHKINIQYKYQANGKDGNPQPCGLCIKIDDNGKKQVPCPPCIKKEMTREEKLAEAIKCISSPLPRWFNEQKRCDPKGVCCRMLGPRSCAEPELSSKIDKFAISYPPNKQALRTELHKNPSCKPNFRCQGTVNDGNYHTFKPNYRDRPLTEKFYSIYEHLEHIDTPEVKHYEDELDKVINYYPRNIFCVPRYTNQYYGWIDSKKTQNLEFCDTSRVNNPRVLQNLRSLKNRRFDPVQLQYCLCHDRMKQMDHWKIV